MTGTIFSIQTVRRANDLYGSIFMFSSGVFSALFLIFPNIPFSFLTVGEDLGDISIKLFASSLS